MAGHDNYLYFHVTRDEEPGKIITWLKAENKCYTMPCGVISVPESCPLRLKMSIRDGFISFAWAAEGEVWHLMGDEMDASFLSDEACNEGWFTGTRAGLCCQALTGNRLPADFDYFEMRVIEE